MIFMSMTSTGTQAHSSVCVHMNNVACSNDSHRHNDGGFMGTTHAISAAAVVLALAAWAPQVINWIIGTHTMPAVITFAIIAAGAALIPDLDNTASTAKSSLGFVGQGVSLIFRGSSRVLQTVIRTPKDDPNPNPHRGAWHTIPAAALLAYCVFLLTSIPGNVTLPFLGRVSISMVVAIALMVLLIHMAMEALPKSLMRKATPNLPGEALDEIASLAVSVIIALILFSQMTFIHDFRWLAWAVFAGMVIHVLGDCCTVAGAPVFFPLSVLFHKKFWWNTRFLPITAGGVVEKAVITPVFSIVCVVALWTML